MIGSAFRELVGSAVSLGIFYFWAEQVSLLRPAFAGGRANESGADPPPYLIE